MLEARIAALEDKLRSATVIDASDLGTDIVRVGSIVHVKDAGGKSNKYTIVGSAEAKPRRPSSPTSPRWARPSSAASAAMRSSISHAPAAKRKLKITKIDVGA